MRDECEHGSLRRSCGYCERDDMIKDAHDALRHIIATANQSRTQSRRLRWIAVRAQDGLDGTTEHQRVDLPKSASQSQEKLRIECVKLRARIAELENALSQVKQWDVEQATETFMKSGKPMQFQLPRAVREQIQTLLQEES